jgi:hypothetical protein
MEARTELGKHLDLDIAIGDAPDLEIPGFDASSDLGSGVVRPRPS